MRSFLLGLAIGLVVMFLALEFSAATSVADASELALEQERSGDVARLEEKVAELEAEIALSRPESEREATSDGDAPAKEAPEAAEAIPASAKADRLKRELDRLVAAGLIGASFENDDDELLEFLTNSWVMGGRPQEALTLLQVFRGSMNVSKLALSVAQALTKAKQPGLAVEAYLMGLEYKPARAIAALLKLAPERALAALDDPALLKKHAGNVRQGRIQLLTALGRVDEAFATADAQLRENKLNNSSWPLLIKASPAEAEKRLRKLASTTSDSGRRRFFELQLVDAMHGLGRTSEAIAKLERGLAESFDTPWVQKLGKLNRAKALSLLEQRTKQHPREQASWNLYGSQLIESGRKADAYRVLDRALTMRYQESIANNMIRADPLRASQRLEGRARQKRDDEMLGDIADALWKAGYKSRARNYYEEALRFDSDDSEWVRKTKYVRSGRSPFGKS